MDFAITQPDASTVSAAFDIGGFRDAIVMPKAQWDSLTPEQREAMATSRYESWRAALAAMEAEAD